MTQSIFKGSFLGFTYNNRHSSTLGITRISDSNRYQDKLIPTLKEITSDINGVDGILYFGTKYTKRDISVSFAFQGMSKSSFEELSDFFNGKEIADLIFDEAPYKVYSAKITGQAITKYLVFGDNQEEYYNGEGSITFTCYFPFARSRYGFVEEYTPETIYEWSNDEYETIGLNQGDCGNVYYDFDISQEASGKLVGEENSFEWVSPNTLIQDESFSDIGNTTLNGSIILYEAELIGSNLNDWLEASRIPSRASGYGTYDEETHTITVFNAGDVLMPTRYWFKANVDVERKMRIKIALGGADSNTVLIVEGLTRSQEISSTGAGGDRYIVVDMINRLIQGYDEYKRPTGRIYNRFITNEDFFGIPLNEQIIYINRKPEQIDYNYLYL